MTAPLLFRFKTLLAGDSGVGKTEFALVASQPPPPPSAPRRTPLPAASTIGVDFVTAERAHGIVRRADGRAVPCSARHQLWDTAGQERFRACVEPMFRNADNVILMYDITNGETFESLCKHWYPLVAGAAPERCQYFIVGTKLDLLTTHGGERPRPVAASTVEAFARQIGARVFETDSMVVGGWRAYETFTDISYCAVAAAPEPPPTRQPLPLAPAPTPARRRCALT